MPFAMIHLNIALNILKSTDIIKKPEDFILGAVAPDSIHFRNEYTSKMKFNSHLCLGTEQWGQITNNREWEENVIQFLRKEKNIENADFLYGYCCHILADIQNNRKVWQPFKERIKNSKIPGVGKKYHQESNDIDYEIFKLPSQNEIWELLSKGDSYEIPNVTRKYEILKMRESLLFEQFTNRTDADISQNEYVKLPDMIKFIEKESEYIMKLLF